ncbi:MAG: LOG family protein [Candidatus Nealsonbacteria bacterium]|nr:LOG family protein [Candidatus Nealsonbacteria bacterium]
MSPDPGKYKIAVSGAAAVGHCCNNIEELSKEVGRQIFWQDCFLLTGATTGVPYFAAVGCKEVGGFSIGFSPAASELAHKKVYKLPLDQFDIIIYTGFDYSGRNLLLTRAADGVIVVCGRMGTLNEFTIAYEDRKPIGVLEGSGGTADLLKIILARPHTKRGPIVYDTDPKKLVQKLIAAIKKTKRSK